LKKFLIQIRVHQYAKNILIFLPLFLSHKIDHDNLLTLTLTAFVCFSFLSSFVYQINDLVDLDSDRHHPKKSKRPLAAKVFSKRFIYFTSIILLISAYAISFFFLSFQVIKLLTVYLVLSLSYTFFLKKIPIIDVITLSIFYTFRIIVGIFVGGLYLSPWIIAFSFFLFLGLAFLKRYIEFINTYHLQESSVKSRGYKENDESILISAGISSGIVSILVLVLYFQSSNFIESYSNPEFIWLSIPVFTFWVIRIWLMANRGLVDDDPVVYAIKDYVSWIVLLVCLVLFAGAIFA